MPVIVQFSQCCVATEWCFNFINERSAAIRAVHCIPGPVLRGDGGGGRSDIVTEHIGVCVSGVYPVMADTVTGNPGIYCFGVKLVENVPG